MEILKVKYLRIVVKYSTWVNCTWLLSNSGYFKVRHFHFNLYCKWVQTLVPSLLLMIGICIGVAGIRCYAILRPFVWDIQAQQSKVKWKTRVLFKDVFFFLYLVQHLGKQNKLTWSILFPRSLNWSAVVMLFVSCVWRWDIRYVSVTNENKHCLTFVGCS